VTAAPGWEDLTGPLCAGRATRQFRAADGQRWDVCEVEQAIPLGSTRTRFLIFDSARVMRRVRRFPADWQALTDAELEAASWRR
jgi:hypothetical protein